MGYFVLIVSSICFSTVYPLPLESVQPSYAQENSTYPDRDDISALKEQVAALSQTVQILVKKTADARLPTYQDQSDSFSPNIRALNIAVVGFTAVLKNNIMDLPTGSTVLYDDVLYNSGSGYDKSTGIFTCPRSGLYLFYINVEPVDSSLPASIEILINGSYRLSAVAERYAAGHDSTGANLLVEHIQEGDRVWVETYLRDNQDLFRGFTSFSGVLIQST